MWKSGLVDLSSYIFLILKLRCCGLSVYSSFINVICLPFIPSFSSTVSHYQFIHLCLPITCISSSSLSSSLSVSHSAHNEHPHYFLAWTCHTIYWFYSPYFIPFIFRPYLQILKWKILSLYLIKETQCKNLYWFLQFKKDVLLHRILKWKMLMKKIMKRIMKRMFFHFFLRKILLQILILMQPYHRTNRTYTLKLCPFHTLILF